MLYVHVEPQGSNKFKILIESDVWLNGGRIVYFDFLFFRFNRPIFLPKQLNCKLMGASSTGGFVSVYGARISIGRLCRLFVRAN